MDGYFGLFLKTGEPTFYLLSKQGSAGSVSGLPEPMAKEEASPC